MSRLSPFFRFGFGWIVVLVGLLVLNGPAFAQEPTGDSGRKAWNLEEVKTLANQLVQEMKEVRVKLRQEPNLLSLSSGLSRSGHQFSEAVKALEKSVKQYASRVNQNASFEATTGIARKVGLQLRDCERLARKLMLTKPTMTALNAAHVTLNKLAPYYGSEPLYPEAESAGDGAS